MKNFTIEEPERLQDDEELDELAEFLLGWGPLAMEAINNRTIRIKDKLFPQSERESEDNQDEEGKEG